MCGRYADPREEEIVEAFDVEAVLAHGEPSWNVSPTQVVRIVVGRAGDAGLPGEGVVRELRAARWGFVPSWAKAVDRSRPLINARAETLTAKPSFRAAASRRRAIVPARGYYEWVTGETGRKTPFFLHPGDNTILGFAGVYEWWRVPDGVDVRGAADGWLCSMAIITRPAMDSIGHIHDRMPVVVPPGLVGAWLDPGLTAVTEVGELLEALPDPVLVPTPRSPA